MQVLDTVEDVAALVERRRQVGHLILAVRQQDHAVIGLIAAEDRRVDADSAFDCIVARTAFQAVIAVTADDDVVAAFAVDRVIAGLGVDVVGRIRIDKVVVAIRAALVGNDDAGSGNGAGSQVRDDDAAVIDMVAGIRDTDLDRIHARLNGRDDFKNQTDAVILDRQRIAGIIEEVVGGEVRTCHSKRCQRIVVEQGVIDAVHHHDGDIHELVYPFRKFVRAEDDIEADRGRSGVGDLEVE